MRRQPSSRLRPLAWLLASVACSSGGGGGGTTEPVQVAELAISPSSLELGEGESAQLAALAFDGAGRQVTGVAVAFSSRSPGIVEATAGGLVTGLADGEGVVRASAGSVHTDVPVTVLGPPPTATTQVPIPSRPFGVAVSSHGVVLVTQQDANSLTRVNLPSTAAAGTIDVGVDPGDVTFSASGARAWATNYIGETVSEIDVASGNVVDTYPASGGSPTHSVLSADETLLYVVTIHGSLNVYSTADGELARSKLVGNGLNGLARHGSHLYIASTDGIVYEVSLPTLAVTRSFPLGGRPQEVAVTSDGSEILVADEMGSVRVIDRATGAASSIGIGSGGFGLALGPGDRYVYVSQPATGNVVVIRRRSRAIAAQIPVGGMPRRVGVHGGSGAVVIANEGGWADVVR